MEGETDASINNQLRLFNERVLPTLDDNIKSGNSLIDTDFYDSELDFGGDKKIKPFHWQSAFPAVFKQGGFDAVIGNPPYGVILENFEKDYYINIFKTTEGRFDKYELFIEKGINLLNKNGELGFIIPSPILTNLYIRKLRKLLIEETSIQELINFEIPVFDDPTVHTCILVIQSKYTKENKINVKNNIKAINELSSFKGFHRKQSDFAIAPNYLIDIYADNKSKKILDKMNMTGIALNELCFIRQCIKTGDDTKYVSKSSKLSSPWKPSLRGKSIGRYSTFEKDLYLKYGDWLARNWNNKSFYETPKIAIRETGNRLTATIDTENRYFLSSLYSIYYKNNFKISDLKYLLGYINSNLANWYMKIIALNLTQGAFTKVRTNQLGRLPIPTIDPKNKTEQLLHDEIVKNVDILLKLNEELPTIKLQTKIEEVQSRIERAEANINQAVYKLYGLTEEEIGIVEG